MAFVNETWPRLREGMDGCCARDHCIEFAAVVSPDGRRLCWTHAVEAKVALAGRCIVDFNQWETEMRKEDS